MDPDNLFQLLIGNAPAPAAQSNVLQAAAMPQDAPQPAPMPVQAPPAAPVAEAPHKRRSLLDTIGRISDVLAKVGGADALYQPTLDAREDRGLKLGDHARLVDSENIKLATDKFDLADKHNTRLGQVARGLKAIQAAGGDINQAFPVLAQRMQLEPDTISSIGHALANDPHALDGLIGATTDPKYDQSKYGGSIVYAKDANGHIVAYQPSLGNDEARNILPAGVEPIDPLKFIDTGGAQVGVGTRSGNPVRILPKTAKPDTVLTTNTSRQNNQDTNRTALTIAGMPARTSAKAGEKAGAGAQDALTLLDNIDSGFSDLHRMGALAGDSNSAVGSVEGALGRTRIGQALGEQAGSAAAQKRLELAKNINSLQSEMIKSLPGSATRTKFEQEIQKARLPDPMKMSYATAQTVIRQLRQSYQTALAASAKETTKPVTPVGRRPQASAGWTLVKVH